MLNFYITLIYFIVFIFGSAIGSFICASVYRTKNNKPIISGRSACPKCGYLLKYYDLIPLFSFIFLGRKCRKCQTKIAWEYFLIEFITGLLFLFAFIFRLHNYIDQGLLNITLLRDWIFLGSIVFLFIYDYKYQVLPDRVTIPASIIIFSINFYLGYNPINLLFSAVIGGWWFGLQYIFSKGRWVGDGDIRMGILLGVVLGFPNIILGLFLSYIIGAFFSIFLVLRKKVNLKSEIAFGTFLSIGGFITLYWGDQIINWYLSLL